MTVQHVSCILFVGVFNGQKACLPAWGWIETRCASPPDSFEGVPHHTSDSAEGRSTTIKGHPVYLNLPASACQMFQSLSFISSHEPCFIFTPLVFFSFFFFALHFTPMREEGKVKLLLLEGGTAETQHCFICFREKPVEIEGFGYREADRVHRPPTPHPCSTDENSDTAETRG